MSHRPKLWMPVVISVCLFAAAANADYSWTGGATAIFQTSDSESLDSEWTLSGDLVFRSTSATGQWLVYAEGSTVPDVNGISSIYPTANADAGSVLNKDGDGGLQISEFNYTFFLQDEKTLAVGLIDPSAWLDVGRMAADENTEFINGSFSHNAAIEFPDYTLGGVFNWSGWDNGPDLAIVFSGSDGIADVADRSYQDLLSLSSNGRGVFVGAQAGWSKNHLTFRLGGWWRSDEHRVLGTTDQTTDGNYGSYVVVGWRKNADSLNFRFGVAKKDVSFANQFTAIAYERQTKHGLFGVGIAHTSVADTFRQRTLADVWDAEVFYRVAFANGRVQLTPSIQHVENPGFDGTGSGVPSTATVASIRVHVSF